jgi:hypothetical protein
MAVTQNNYTGNGSTVLFSFTFPYINSSDVKVSLNGTDTTAYSLANATTVEMDAAPTVGQAVIVYRNTDDSALAATFYPGSAIRAADLNDDLEQVLFISQEVRTQSESTDSSAIAGVAQDALDTANAANATAATALDTANAAETTADGIASTANTALSNSSAAVATADGIAATANTALSNSTAAVNAAAAAVPLAGGTMTGVITYATAQPRLVHGTAVASTSGTSIDFTGIPSWVKRISVILNSVSTNGISGVEIRLGDSGGVEATGYTVLATAVNNVAVTNVAPSSTGFLILGETTVDSRSGILVLANIASNTWIGSGSFTFGAFAGSTVGTKTLSDTLDRIRLTTVNGTDTFDLGTVNIIYEG